MAESRLAKPFATTRKARHSGMFLHIHKCGGTSVRAVFDQYENLHVSHNDGLLHGSQEPLEIVYGCDNPELFEFTFAFVRNPFDRIAAMWQVFSQRRPEGITMDCVIHVASLNGLPKERRRGIASDHELWMHTRPCSWFELERMDAIYCLEDADSAWCDVQLRLGFEHELPRLNRSGIEQDRTAIFSAEQQNAIETIYKEDLNRFGYSFTQE